MSGCDSLTVVAFGSLLISVALIWIGEGFRFGFRQSTRDRMMLVGLLLLGVFIVAGLIVIDPEACAVPR